jgi:hypothetical protein
MVGTQANIALFLVGCLVIMRDSAVSFQILYMEANWGLIQPQQIGVVIAGPSGYSECSDSN